MDGPRLAIIIPAHREAQTIAAIASAAGAFGTVLVVDDCSPDDTAEVARVAGAEVIRNERNLGYDGTLSRGFDEVAARGFTHAVTIDADGEHDPRHLGEFRRLLIDDKVPLVLGYRPRKQRIAEVVMGLYVRMRFGVRDILCGMKGYDLDLLRQNGGFDHTNSIGTELAIRSIQRGAHFAQVPIDGEERRDAPRFGPILASNIRILRALARVLRQEITTTVTK